MIKKKLLRDSPINTLPWRDEEFAVVNGIPCIYDEPSKFDHHKDDLFVHVPGLVSARISALQKMGFKVDPPKQVRTVWFA